jgi:hypothetical protein
MEMKNGNCSMCGMKMEFPDEDAAAYMCETCAGKKFGLDSKDFDSEEKIREFENKFDNMMNTFTTKASKLYWKHKEEELKQMAKKELADEAFFEGAQFMFNLMINASAFDEKNNRKKQK